MAPVAFVLLMSGRWLKTINVFGRTLPRRGVMP